MKKLTFSLLLLLAAANGQLNAVGESVGPI